MGDEYLWKVITEPFDEVGLCLNQTTPRESMEQALELTLLWASLKISDI